MTLSLSLFLSRHFSSPWMTRSGISLGSFHQSEECLFSWLLEISSSHLLRGWSEVEYSESYKTKINNRREGWEERERAEETWQTDTSNRNPANHLCNHFQVLLEGEREKMSVIGFWGETDHEDDSALGFRSRRRHYYCNIVVDLFDFQEFPETENLTIYPLPVCRLPMVLFA